MSKKSILDISILSLFIMCMAFALSATLERITLAREREFLLQGIILLVTVGLVIALVIFLRVCNIVSKKLSEKASSIIAAVFFVLIFALGAAVRIWVINTIRIAPASDFETFYKVGEMLANDTLMRPENASYREYIAKFPHVIGYPRVVLGPIFSIFGADARVGLMANMAYNMGSVALAYYIPRYLFNRLTGICTMALMAFWPSIVLYSSMLASEPPFTFYIMLAMLMAVLILKKGPGSFREQRPIFTSLLMPVMGVVLGVANSIRPMALVLVIALCFALLVRSKSGKIAKDDGLSRQILSRGWLCAIIVILPFQLTGMILSGGVERAIGMPPASGTSAMGYNLMVGVNSEHLGIWNVDDAVFFDNAFVETGDAGAAHAECMDVALKRITGNPENVLNLLVYKYRDLWETDDFGIDWNLLWAEQQGLLTAELHGFLEMLRPIQRQAWFMLLLLAVIAALYVWWKNEELDGVLITLMLFFMGTAVLHMLLETQVRYHYNMIPFLMLVASYSLYHWQYALAARQLKTVSLKVGSQETPPSASPEVQETKSHMDFDLGAAVREGSVLISVTQASAEAATPGIIAEATPALLSTQAAETMVTVEEEKEEEKPSKPKLKVKVKKRWQKS